MTDSSAPATKKDIQLLMEQMAKLFDRFHTMDEKMNSLVDEKTLDKKLKALEKRINTETKDYFNFYTGKLHKDFLGATQDEVQIVKETMDNHELRITQIEHAIAA